LSGTVLTPEHGTPLDVRYRVEAGPDGLTRRVELELDGGAVRRVLLADGAGRWRWGDGPELPEVAGALDVDLTVTPATNTLPIRRLARHLETGQAADLQMAWVQFPDLEVILSAQRYERLAPDRWRFSTGDFSAELRVDPDGLVLDYGGLFRSLAYRPDTREIR
ncbi:MAG TPA: putative glycolipid-binding domain-containing protein, partial [Actinomycetes bacterium]|nr:putative glycolipid-binding domain-containing protein [Actinomycetes bacterium]